MTKRKALVFAMVLALAAQPMIVAVVAFDGSSADSSTVVVAVGDPGTESGRATFTAAQAIAAQNDYPLVRVPGGGSDDVWNVIETLSPRVELQNVDHAIVVGTESDNASTVANTLKAVGEKENGEYNPIGTVTEVIGDTPSDVVERGVHFYWDSSSTAFVTTYSAGDTKKVELALSNDTHAGNPVLSPAMGYSDLEGELSDLGTSTVYVTPDVSQTIRDKLSNDGYTVKTKVDGVSLDQKVHKVSTGFADDSKDVVVVGEQTHVYAAAQSVAGANSSVVVTKSSSTLGSDANDYFNNSTNTSQVYILGGEDDVDDTVLSEISSVTADSVNVSRVMTHGYTETFLRMSLLVADWEHPLFTSHVTKVNESTVKVTHRNIGFETAKKSDTANWTVKSRWPSGNVESSSPNGEQAGNGDWLVFQRDQVAPGGAYTVTLDASGELDHGGHPIMTYHYQKAGGGFGSLTSGLDIFDQLLSLLPDWMADTIDDLLPTLKLPVNLGPVEIVIAGGIFTGIVGGGFWLVRRRRT